MRAHSPVTAAEARAAVAAILDRRTTPDRGVPDVDAADLLDVDDYIRRHPAPGIAGPEALDELVLLGHLAGEVDRRTLDAIERARDGGCTWREIGDQLRVRSPQAAEQVYLRLLDRVRGADGTRSEAAGRRLRQAPPPAAALAVREGGLDAPELRQALLALVRCGALIADDEASAAVRGWRSEIYALPGARLARQLRTLLPMQLEGVDVPEPVRRAVEALWPHVEAWALLAA